METRREETLMKGKNEKTEGKKKKRIISVFRMKAWSVMWKKIGHISKHSFPEAEEEKSLDVET
jgi:hypothetical protein